ncbi:SDR family NAD(P)-dependent oxidoreductase [Micrococcales bacterium 31B]|nr:SDR family NAD(P)-dependent oxidoreductase [Micrococcales bacterium 31B]
MPLPELSMPDLTGKHAVVTGANQGLGLCTAERFALAGADVTLAVRRPERAEPAIARIAATCKEAGRTPPQLRVQLVDLASQASVRSAADDLTRAERPIDYLILNAGIMHEGEQRFSEDGFDLHMASNMWGHFALTGRLLPLLRGGRVVSLGSVMAHVGSLRRENLNGERHFNASLMYGTTKLAAVGFAKELQRRSLAHDWGVTALAAHPGASRTHLTDRISNGGGKLSAALSAIPRILGHSLRGIWQTPEMGCLPIVHAATSEFARGGDYFGPSGFMECNGYPTLARVPRGARSLERNQKFFDEAEKLTAVHYGDFAR